MKQSLVNIQMPSVQMAHVSEAQCKGTLFYSQNDRQDTSVHSYTLGQVSSPITGKTEVGFI